MHPGGDSNPHHPVTLVIFRREPGYPGMYYSFFSRFLRIFVPQFLHTSRGLRFGVPCCALHLGQRHHVALIIFLSTGQL